jgi:hypothetical protein
MLLITNARCNGHEGTTVKDCEVVLAWQTQSEPTEVHSQRMWCFHKPLAIDCTVVQTAVWVPPYSTHIPSLWCCDVCALIWLSSRDHKHGNSANTWVGQLLQSCFCKHSAEPNSYHSSPSPQHGRRSFSSSCYRHATQVDVNTI